MRHVLLLVVLAGLLVPQSYAQISRRSFDAPLVVVDEYHRIEHLLDIDDDGYPDALSWRWSSSTPQRNVVTGLLGTGDGDFTPVWTAEFPPASSGGFSQAVSAVTDFDGDAKLDLVIAQGNVIKFFHLRGTDPPIEAWS